MNISVTHQNARRAAFGVEMTPGYYYPGYPHLSVDGNYRLMSTLEDTLRCDGCGASFGAWDKCGAWHAVDDTGPLNSGYDEYLFGRYPDLETCASPRGPWQQRAIVRLLSIVLEAPRPRQPCDATRRMTNGSASVPPGSVSSSAARYEHPGGHALPAHPVCRAA